MSPDSTEHRSVVIVTGAAPLLPAAVQSLPTDAFIIAADSGLDHARGAGLRPDLVVGDLDSVSESGLSWARARRIPIERHPVGKDSTDTELAIGLALAEGATELCIVAGESYRLDHTIGAITALGHASLAGCTSLEARWGCALLRVLHGPRAWAFDLDADVTFSLLALHGECVGVTLAGARWPLSKAVIAPGSSLGVSNVSAAREDDDDETPPESTIRLSIERGVLTMIFPDYFGGSL